MERRHSPGDERTTEDDGRPGDDPAFAATLPRGEGPIVVNRRNVGRFRIDGDLGSGGMADVFRAHDPMLDRPVALKVLHARRASSDADTSGLRRVLREARAAAALTHPNTVTIYEVGEADGEVFIAMELLRGSSLRDVLVGGAATREEKLRWLVQAARALAAAHERGLVHRDVKPENMFVCVDGSLKLLDFGIAKRDDADEAADDAYSTGPSSLRTEAGLRFGTPRYMAPEQRAGAGTDVRTDQYAWGLVAFELFASGVSTSEDLATAQDDGEALPVFETAEQRVQALLAREPGLPEPIARVIARALEPVKEQRLASMTEVIAVLDEHAAWSGAGGSDGVATREPPAPAASAATDAPAAASPPPSRPGASRSRAIALGAAVVLGSVAVLAGVKLRERLASRSGVLRPDAPAFVVASTQDIVTGPHDEVVALGDGSLVYARDPSQGLRFEHGADAGTPNMVPYPVGVPGDADSVRVVWPVGLTVRGAPMLFAGITMGPVGNAEHSGTLMLMGGPRDFAMQRAFGLPDQLDARSGGDVVYVAIVTRNAGNSYGLPMGVVVQALGGPRPNLTSVIERGPSGVPALAVSTTRLAVAYRLGDQSRLAYLDRDLRLLGDVITLPGAVGLPMPVFVGDRTVVFSARIEAGKTRIVRTMTGPDDTTFGKVEEALAEPVTDDRPIASELPDGTPVLAWRTSRGARTVIRVARVAPDGSLHGASDVGSGGVVEAVLATTTPAGVTFAWHDGAGHATVANVTCQPEVSRPER